jgi:hypothetical protein
MVRAMVVQYYGNSNPGGSFLLSVFASHRAVNDERRSYLEHTNHQRNRSVNYDDGAAGGVGCDVGHVREREGVQQDAYEWEQRKRNARTSRDRSSEGENVDRRWVMTERVMVVSGRGEKEIWWDPMRYERLVSASVKNYTQVQRSKGRVDARTAQKEGSLC